MVIYTLVGISIGLKVIALLYLMAFYYLNTIK